MATGVGVGVGSTGLKTGLISGFAAAFTVTPLFQTSFAPDLIHVNFLPEAVAVEPAFVHFAPAFTAAKDGAEIKDKDRSNAVRTRVRVMASKYQ